MLFKERHIEQIRDGEKTVTRREWSDTYAGPNVGTVVAAKTELFTPDAECDCFIQITGRREEPLGGITEASARREGDYESIGEFREGYECVYGEGAWDPRKVVSVVEFEYVGRERPDERLIADGGLPEGFAEPDVYTLEIPADGYEDVTQWTSGKLTIEQTPEQREQFLAWIRSEVEDADLPEGSR